MIEPPWDPGCFTLFCRYWVDSRIVCGPDADRRWSHRHRRPLQLRLPVAVSRVPAP